jgi:hypothetical protein
MNQKIRSSFIRQNSQPLQEQNYSRLETISIYCFTTDKSSCVKPKTNTNGDTLSVGWT